MLGYMVAISCMGYMAFYLYIQLGQLDRIVTVMDRDALTAEQFNLLRDRMGRSVTQLRNEMIGLAVIGTLVSVIGGVYTYNLVVRPLRKLVEYADTQGKTELPEIKTNNEIKQLAAALSHLAPRPGEFQKK
ncbi:MAG: hypothetical protein HY579_00525 [Nitrospinae bacterium]|nr:hypothetical protein [Nitrospinota bacterium]